MPHASAYLKHVNSWNLLRRRWQAGTLLWLCTARWRRLLCASSIVRAMLVMPAKKAAPALPLSSSGFGNGSLRFSSAHLIVAEDLRLTLDLAPGYPSLAEILQHGQMVRFRSRRPAWPSLSPAQPWPLMKRTHMPSAKGAVFWSPPGPLRCLSFAEGQRVRGVQAVKSSRDALLFLSLLFPSS